MAVQTEAVRANAAAQEAHADELKSASVLVAAAEARFESVAPAPDMRASDEAVADARRNVADTRAMNPMFRVAATWSRTPVEQLTSEQFESVKHWAVWLSAPRPRSPLLGGGRRLAARARRQAKQTQSRRAGARRALAATTGDPARCSWAGRIQGPHPPRLRAVRSADRQGSRSRRTSHERREIHDTSRIDAFMRRAGKRW